MGIHRGKETKRDKSIRLMKKRVENAQSVLDRIANLSTAKYSYTEKELDNMISVLNSKHSYVIECLERRRMLNSKL
ncbi:hypothetical protein [Bacillus altitudinis]|uniref:hypothetical protein n=1 Tax=Bacillus altitudinis TaxID=293387 RepID=UPI000DBBEE5F|nr:hypothetical protein [Bacillus altitudinis]SPR95087.1 conserved hypothetical protein [Bacillus altitudinis]